MFVSFILLRVYQGILSPFLGGQCRFYPSCSAFALEAVCLLPPFQAVRVVLRRLLSCHPLHRGGFDPLKV